MTIYCWYYQEGHEEAQEEFSKKAKFFFSAAVQKWDADFYVKVDDNIDLDLGKDYLYISVIVYRLVDPLLWKLIDTFLMLIAGLTEGLIGVLDHRRGQDGAYIGCMKSGEVVTEEYILWFNILLI